MRVRVKHAFSTKICKVVVVVFEVKNAIINKAIHACMHIYVTRIIGYNDCITCNKNMEQGELAQKVFFTPAKGQ